MVFDTSSGMMKIIRKEKYQAIRTASVTSTGCLIQFEYLDNCKVNQRIGLVQDLPHLHNNAAEMMNAVMMSKTNKE